ncbi:uncharacterized protein N7500_009649 [Penicillium coprophilum]|uniref:uncharacterized protein n=1 Tax=Penicillium coprophilum TaxID=36646 RepID=UPI0023A3182E|nr:uncharacterized protein N7500_009649 [Penicillium coprophilum]KAJ5154210.1 hypothetical protein N7500_009649 [Penicillium coprophilum]
MQSQPDYPISPNLRQYPRRHFHLPTDITLTHDKRLPFAKWVSKVDSKRKMSMNAIAPTSVTRCHLSTLNPRLHLTLLDGSPDIEVYSMSCVIYGICHSDPRPPWAMGWGLSTSGCCIIGSDGSLIWRLK